MRTSDTEEDKRDGDSAEQKHRPVTLSETVRVKKKTSTPIVSDKTVDKGAVHKNTKTLNKNPELTQGKQTDTVHTDKSYFDVVWTVFSGVGGRDIGLLSVFETCYRSMVTTGDPVPSGHRTVPDHHFTG